MQRPEVTVCTEKNIQDYWCGKQITMSADRVKPAYILEETWHSTTTTNTSNSPAHPTEPQLQMPHQLLRLCGPQALVAVLVFQRASKPMFSFPGGEGGWCGNIPSTQNGPFHANVQRAPTHSTVSCSPHCCDWRQLMVNLQLRLLHHLPNTYTGLAYCDSTNVRVNIKNK